jgi:hypothetical protein
VSDARKIGRGLKSFTLPGKSNLRQRGPRLPAVRLHVLEPMLLLQKGVTWATQGRLTPLSAALSTP